MKRKDGLAGHGSGTLAGPLQQRGDKAGRWRTTDTRFPPSKRGYDIADVNRWLDRIDSLREKGFAPARYAPRGGFIRWWRGRCYDAEVVDQYLAGLPAEAAAAGLCVLPAPPVSTIDWWEASDLPGARLTRRSGEITSSSGEVLLTRHRRTITLASGRIYRLDRSQVPWRDEDLQLSDAATGEPLLWLRGCHFEREAGGQVLFPGRRYLTFPINLPPGDPVMSAVSESGSTVLWFRTSRPAEQEVIVSPDSDLTPEILCVIELAAPWRSSYFGYHPGGAGGG